MLFTKRLWQSHQTWDNFLRTTVEDFRFSIFFKNTNLTIWTIEHTQNDIWRVSPSLQPILSLNMSESFLMTSINIQIESREPKSTITKFTVNEVWKQAISSNLLLFAEDLIERFLKSDQMCSGVSTMAWWSSARTKMRTLLQSIEENQSQPPTHFVKKNQSLIQNIRLK